MLENLHEPMISKKMEKNRTLLHYHFRSKRITGVDHDELEVARWLLERSIMVSSNNRNNGLIGPYDDHGNSPLHYLFEFRFRNIISYMQYISLIMEDMSDWVVDREQARKTSTSCAPAEHCCCYWNEVMTQCNSWNVTPLHLMADNPDVSYEDIVRVVKECNQSWECHHVGMDDGSRGFVKTRDDYCYRHPLLHPDQDGEIPLCYIWTRPEGGSDENVYDDTSSLSDKNQSLFVDAFLGFVDCDYKITYHGAFQAMFAFLESFCDKHDESLNELYQSNKWWSAEDREVRALQHFLCSKECIRNVFLPDQVHSCLVSFFWTPMRILLEAAIKCNLHYLKIEHNNKKKESQVLDSSYYGYQQYSISSQPVHLAASVANFPAYVLQLTLLLSLYDEPHTLLQRDEHGRIPLHYALLATPSVPPAVDQHAASVYDEHVVYWNSEYEPRSMVQYIVDHEPSAVNIPDVDGRLPIHLAIVYHLRNDNHHANKTVLLEKVLCPIVNAAPNHMSSVDPRTNLKPFMLAATTKDALLDAVYLLLRLDPSMLFQ